VGGAINIISKRPTDDFEGEFKLGFGNFDQKEVGFSLSGTIIEDWLRGRVVAYKEVRDEGVYYNHGTGDTEGYNIDNWNGEIQFEGDIGENFSWWTKYTSGRYTQAGPPGGSCPRTWCRSLARAGARTARVSARRPLRWVVIGNRR
jgi:iron complex outermembrane receptor protein